MLLSERAGVPRRITIASIVYEQAISATSAVVVAAYFIISHPDLQGQPLRWAVLLLIPLAIALLHPRVFGPLANRALRAFGREPLPAVISLRGVLALLVFYSPQLGGRRGRHLLRRPLGHHDPVRATSSSSARRRRSATSRRWSPSSPRPASAFATPPSPGRSRSAVPGDSFAVGSLIAIAVRGVLTVVEVIYVGVVTALGRREGWAIPTGVLHAVAGGAGSRRRTLARHAPEIL